ncbi:type II secretion system F family protein [Candidatus Riflebacteria bacterium]
MDEENKEAPWYLGGDITPLLNKFGIGTSVNNNTLMFFYVQLSILLGAGCTILDSLRGIGRQISHPYFKKVLLDVADELERGKTLSEAFRVYRKVFPEIFCSLIYIGEETGTLEDIVGSYAEAEERSAATKALVKKALIYPAILMILSAVVVSVLMIFVFPKFMKVINKPVDKMPLPTQLVIHTSNFLVAYGIPLFGGIILTVVGYMVLNSTPGGKRFFDMVKVNVPIFKMIFIKSDCTLFCRTLAIMLKAGLPIVRAVKIVGSTVANELFRDCVQDLEDRIAKGEGFTRILRTYPQFFSETMILLSDTGEKTGNQAEMLIKISDYTDEELKTAIEVSTAVLEPLLIIIVACMVGIITAAMFLPLFEMGKSM